MPLFRDSDRLSGIDHATVPPKTQCLFVRKFGRNYPNSKAGVKICLGCKLKQCK